uniref:Uncharacterized protein n=1 Tax=Oryza barthii TaxID=65489 RepID=A0A0D3HNV3_9ORYZ
MFLCWFSGGRSGVSLLPVLCTGAGVVWVVGRNLVIFSCSINRISDRLVRVVQKKY